MEISLVLQVEYQMKMRLTLGHITLYHQGKLPLIWEHRVVTQCISKMDNQKSLLLKFTIKMQKPQLQIMELLKMPDKSSLTTFSSINELQQPQTIKV